MFCERCSDLTRGMEHDPAAGLFAELLTGSCIWKDEICRQWCFPCQNRTRRLFHARYCMTVGEPVEPEHQSLWDQAERDFPNWPIFRPERRSSAIADQVRRLVEDNFEKCCGDALESMGDEAADMRPHRPSAITIGFQRLLRFLRGRDRGSIR